MKIETLQLLRFFAASLVVVDHVFMALFARGYVSAFSQEVGHQIGGFGVIAFFSISGFVMAFTTASSESGRTTAMRFWRNRIARVVPLYWLFTVFALVFEIASDQLLQNGKTPTAEQFIQSLLFIPYLNSDGEPFPLVGVGWTLNFEMFFYTIFGFALLFGSKRSRLILASALVVGLVAVGLLVRPQGVQGQFLTGGVMLYFVGGIAAYAAYQWLSGQPHRKWFAPVGWTLIALSALVHGYFRMELDVDAGEQYLTVFLVSIAVALIASSPLFVRGVTRWLSFGGDMSFSLYLAHVYVIRVAFLLARPLLNHTTAIPIAVAAFVLSVGAGAVVYAFVERPIGRLFKARQPLRHTTGALAP